MASAEGPEVDSGVGVAVVSRPRIRSIKPELWHDEAVGEISRDARLLFVGLITMADDAGRLRYAAPGILGHVFPYDDDVTAGKLRRWVDELVEHGLIHVYECDDREYMWLPGWRDNQRINRPTPSKLPCPNDPRASWPPHDGLIESSLNETGAFTE